MAILNVCEFASIRDAGAYPAQVTQVPPLAKQNVAIGAASVASTNGFAPTTKAIRVATDTACWILIGASPTATTTADLYMPAGTVEYWGVNPGDKIAVIAA
jgi:hypothetical protein